MWSQWSLTSLGRTPAGAGKTEANSGGPAGLQCLSTIRGRSSSPHHAGACGVRWPCMVGVSVLGELRVESDGRWLEPIASHRARSLLGWLAVHPGLHPRGRVASVFWPDALEASARSSLRTTLATLRRALGPAAADVVTATRERVGIEPGLGTSIDSALSSSWSHTVTSRRPRRSAMGSSWRTWTTTGSSRRGRDIAVRCWMCFVAWLRRRRVLETSNWLSIAAASRWRWIRSPKRPRVI